MSDYRRIEQIQCIFDCRQIKSSLLLANKSPKYASEVYLPAQGTSTWIDSKTGLARIESKIYRAETVRLDGHFFENCVFENCLLSYGGELCEWNNSRFSNCRIILDGKANHTTQVLQALGFRIVAEDNSSSLQSAGPDA